MSEMVDEINLKNVVQRFIVMGLYIWGFYLILCFIRWEIPVGTIYLYSIGSPDYSFAYVILRVFGIVHIISTYISLITKDGRW